MNSRSLFLGAGRHIESSAHRFSIRALHAIGLVGATASILYAIGGGPLAAEGAYPTQCGGKPVTCFDPCERGLWRNGVIPYEIDSSAAAREAELRKAMDVWESMSGSRIQFVEDNVSNPRLIIKDGGTVCKSGIPGRHDENTEAYLPSGCPLQHELGHVIGLSHEHQRFDRDRYVKFGFDPLSTCDLYHNNGVRCAFASTGSDFGPYRTDSCMHYNSVPVFSIMEKATGGQVPTNDDVTTQDAANAREMYSYEYHWSKFFPLSEDRAWDRPLDVRINSTSSILGSPAITSQGGAQVLDAFVRGSDLKIYHRYQTPVGWSGYDDLGGPFDTDPAAGAFGKGKIVVAATRGKRVSTRRFGGNTWQAWVDQGAPVGTRVCSAPSLATFADTGYLFALGCNRGIYVKVSTDAGKVWSDWKLAGGLPPSGVRWVGKPVATAWSPTHVDLFINSSNGHIWHKWYDSGWKPGWEDMLCCAKQNSSPAVAASTPGRIDILYRGADDGLWWYFYDSGQWYGSFSLGALLFSDPAATSGYPEHIDVLGILGDGGLWHRWYHCTGSGSRGSLPCHF